MLIKRLQAFFYSKSAKIYLCLPQTQLITKARGLTRCLSTFGSTLVRGQGGGWGKG